MGLVSLPVELLSNIILHLDTPGRDVLHCRAVCTVLKDIVDEDAHIQYKIELTAAGMEDGANSTLTVSERLSLLRERQDAWATFAWRSQEDIDTSQDTESRCWELCGGVLAQQLDRELHFWQLPSRVRRIPGKRWALDDMGVSEISHVVMDPAQDLLVIVEEVEQGELYHIHFKSMTTGITHPGAASAALVHMPQHVELIQDYSTQISGYHLALLVMQQPDDWSMDAELLLWNWKTGELLLNVTQLGSCCSFAFLGRRYVLLLTIPTTGSGEIEDLPGTPPGIYVIDLDKAPCEPVKMEDLEYLCVFSYPPLSKNSTIFYTTLRANPGPAWLPAPSLPVPFSVSRVDRLLVATLEVIDSFAISHWFLSLYVPSSTLFSALETLAPGQSRRIFAWCEWGPSGSRLQLLSQMPATTLPCFPYGMSCVTMQEHIRLSDPGSCTIEIYDFNPFACRRALLSRDGTAQAGSDKDALVAAPTTVRKGNIFEEDITTNCPCLRKEIQITGDDDEDEIVFDGVLLGEDSLILVASDAVTPDPFYRVLTI